MVWIPCENERVSGKRNLAEYGEWEISRGRLERMDEQSKGMDRTELE